MRGSRFSGSGATPRARQRRFSSLATRLSRRATASRNATTSSANAGRALRGTSRVDSSHVPARALQAAAALVHDLAPSFHQAVGGDVAEQPRQVFLGIPAQMTEDEAERLGEFGVAFDAHVAHRRLQSVHQQPRQVGHREAQAHLGCFVTAPLGELTLVGHGKVDLGHRAEDQPRRASRVRLQALASPAGLGQQMVGGREEQARNHDRGSGEGLEGGSPRIRSGEASCRGRGAENAAGLPMPPGRHGQARGSGGTRGSCPRSLTATAGFPRSASRRCRRAACSGARSRRRLPERLRPVRAAGR